MHRFSKKQLLRAAGLPAAALLFGAVSRPETTVSPRVLDAYGKLSLSFEANRGQTDRQVKFLSRGRGYTLFLSEGGAAVLSLHGREGNAALRMTLRGGNAHANVSGTDPLPGKSNYFVGNDPSQWHTDIPTYGAVKYTGVYSGIDLVYHGNQQLLEYDFVLAPGADPRAIDIRFQGADKVSVNGDGALVIGVGGDEVVERAPVVYQETSGRREKVAGRYVLRAKGRVGFEVAAYDRGQTLVIDPTLMYSTYLGAGSSPTAVAVDASGNAYLTGQAANFRTTPGSFLATRSDGIFVVKLNAAGSALSYSTYLGGSSEATDLQAIAVDASGDAYVAGATGSADFPTTPGAFQRSFGGGGSDAFISKLNPAGSALIYSTLIGGSEHDKASAIAIDPRGNAYITGRTDQESDAYSSTFPITPGAFQPSRRGRLNAFVSKLSANGSALAYSTYLGGSHTQYQTGLDYGSSIAIDASGDAYVTGATQSTDFPVTLGAFQTTLGGGTNAFVTKLNAAGSGLIYSTYLGGFSPSPNETVAYGIAVDASGSAYVAGTTTQAGFPVTSGAFQTTFSGSSGFVSKLNAAGTALVYSTYLAGVVYPVAGIAIDSMGNTYVSGRAGPELPTTPDALPTSFTGYYLGFVTELNATGSTALFSTYLGGGNGTSLSGSNGTQCGSIAVDASGNVYAAGFTSFSDFPTTPGAFQTTFNGGDYYDFFIMKLNLSPPSSSGLLTTATVSGPPGNNGLYLGAVTVTLVARPGKSPISATYYSLDKAPYQAYSGPFSISAPGVHSFFYYSVDTAGEQEARHWKTVGIDDKPRSQVGVSAVISSPNFLVEWEGRSGTSDVKSASIYVSDNGGPFVLWLSNVPRSGSIQVGSGTFYYGSAWYSGALLHTYAFYSIATDSAGNVENAKTVADATTKVPQVPGDVNGDSKIDCADVALVRASLGKSTSQAGFNPSADLNKDGVVNILDLAMVAQKLAPGMTCP